MSSIKRRRSTAVNVGGVTIGGGKPIVIQSMTHTPTADLDATLHQIKQLAAAGCALVRVAVPDLEAARSLHKLVAGSPVPLVADIHFNIDLAYRSLEQGAAKVRINPGNLGGSAKLAELCRRADDTGAALRVGVNAGSLERPLRQKFGGVTAQAMVESALAHLDVAEKTGFTQMVVSLKASDVLTTIKAYRLIAGQAPYPLHLGVTAAGPLESGTVKGAVGVGALLSEGIGDTIRISLTADPLAEVRLARQILEVLHLLPQSRPEIISCPTCGRCTVELIPLVNQVSKILKKYPYPIKVAVMGCVVNGPGEAREADIGITAGPKGGALFRGGRVIRRVPREQLLEALERELQQVTAKDGASK